MTQDKGKFPGSPFKIQVGDGQLVNPSKVKVGGAIRDGEANKVNDITFDCTAAGKLSYILTLIQILWSSMISWISVPLLYSIKKCQLDRSNSL